MNMSTTLKKIKEFYARLRKDSGVLLPAWREVYGETPTLSFSDLISAYLRDPACKAFVDFLADQAVGMGFYTTVNSEYARAEEAKQVVDEFNESVNLDGLLQIGAREVVACGNSFWEKIEPNRLEQLRILPLTSLEKIVRDQYGNVQGYRQTPSYGGKTLAPERIIHFKWNPVNGEAFGTGVLQSLCETLSFNGETRMSFLEMKARIEKAMSEIFEKYAGPDELWLFPGVSAEKLAEYQSLIKSKPKAGARFVYDRADADIKTVTVDPRARYEAYVEHILNQVYLGGQTPLPKLFTTPGFTEASAGAALKIAERKVMALQRFIKRIVEREIFVPVIQQAGLNPKLANCRLAWGMEEKPEIKLEDWIRLAEISAEYGIPYVRAEEVRKNLMNFGFELWEEEQVATAVTETRRR